MEEYAHYWAVNPQPSYWTTCLTVYLDGLPSKNTPAAGSAITIGEQIPDNPLNAYPGEEDVHTDARGRALPEGRHRDPASRSYSVVKTVRPVHAADKYAILRELFTQFERMENTIQNFEVSPGLSLAPDAGSGGFNPLTAFADTNLFPLNQIRLSDNRTISDEFYEDLDRNRQLDGIRANIAALYQDALSQIGSARGGGGRPASDQRVSMPALPGIAQSCLDGGDAGEEPEDGADGKTALPEYQKLSAYIDRALALDSLLQSDQSGKTEKGPAYEVQRYRNYAMGIARLEFQISCDALLQGHLGMNPVREEINELYTTAPIAVVVLIIDLLAFFSGLLLFKSIYLFGKNAGILQMGYLNYDIALSYLFTPPKDAHSRVLHLAFLYRVLCGDAPSFLEDSEEPPSDGDGPDLNGESPDAGSDREEDSSDPAPEDAGSPGRETATEPEPLDGENGEEADSQAPPEGDGGGDAAEQPASAAGGEPQRDGIRADGEDPAEKYLRELDCLHKIMASPDCKGLEKTMWATLKMLGITEFTSAEESDDSYASLQLWLRSFVEENAITFDGLFPPKED